MALKDWRKVKSLSDIGYGWRNKKNNKKIIYINVIDEKYKYLVIYHIEYSSPRILKRAMTKSEALKFAKAYMRKH